MEATPWLVVRYRAENLDTERTDYLVFADDGVEGRQLDALRLCDAKYDGRWHTAAVDLSLLTEAESELRISGSGRASEVYLFLPEALIGPDEPACGGGRFHAVGDVDRFCVRLDSSTRTARPKSAL